jgi:hypothetical protein
MRKRERADEQSKKGSRQTNKTCETLPSYHRIASSLYRCPRITVSRRPYILTSVRSSSELPRGALVIAKRSAHQNYMPNWLQLGRADGWMPVPPWKGMKQIVEERERG